MLMCCLVKEFFAISLDLRLVLLVDLGWIFNTARLEVGIGKLVCNLNRKVSKSFAIKGEY